MSEPSTGCAYISHLCGQGQVPTRLVCGCQCGNPELSADVAAWGVLAVFDLGPERGMHFPGYGTEFQALKGTIRSVITRSLECSEQVE